MQMDGYLHKKGGPPEGGSTFLPHLLRIGYPVLILDDFYGNYCPSCTNGDYSPGNPWDAPGMSIHDFI